MEYIMESGSYIFWSGLLAASGLRAGELLGLEVRHFDGTSVRVEQEIWKGQVCEPKTPNARRVVDLHPDVSTLLQQFIGSRTKGYLFRTKNGYPMNQRNLARSLYSVLDDLEIPRCGFHSFRRYRNTFLRNLLAPV
jgi:integrase